MIVDADLLRAVLLGVVQGLTEFLPISSTAHLILFPRFFGWSGTLDSLTFNVGLHGGTLLSLLVCFYRDWIRIFLRDRRLLGILVVATLPAGVAGILLHDAVETAFRNPLLIAAALAAFGVLMLVAERRSRGTGTVERITLMDGLIIGAAQAVALIPGVSRSGITITAGLFRRLDRREAARFSFLLSTPVIGGACLLHARKLIAAPESYPLNLFIAGFIAAFVSGMIAIKFLLRFLKDHRLDVFVYYRWALAGGILVAYFQGYLA